MTERTVRQPTDEEQAQLDRMTSQAVGRVAMRVHMIQLSARGVSAQEIAEIHDCADVTVYKWIGRFEVRVGAERRKQVAVELSDPTPPDRYSTNFFVEREDWSSPGDRPEANERYLSRY